MKGHLKVLLDKASTDDKLVDALREECRLIRERFTKAVASGALPPGGGGGAGAGGSEGGTDGSGGDGGRLARMAVEQVCVCARMLCPSCSFTPPLSLPTPLGAHFSPPWPVVHPSPHDMHRGTALPSPHHHQTVPLSCCAPRSTPSSWRYRRASSRPCVVKSRPFETSCGRRRRPRAPLEEGWQGVAALSVGRHQVPVSVPALSTLHKAPSLHHAPLALCPVPPSHTPWWPQPHVSSPAWTPAFLPRYPMPALLSTMQPMVLDCMSVCGGVGRVAEEAVVQ
jgi:hypothetical protein